MSFVFITISFWRAPDQINLKVPTRKQQGSNGELTLNENDFFSQTKNPFPRPTSILCLP